MPPKPGLPYTASIGGAGTTRTLSQSASSSSAMIKGSEVIDPCPISVAADMIVIVPSGAMLIHGFMAWPVRSPASTAASAALPRSANANVRPAAPIMIWRRLSDASELLRGLFMSGLLRGALNRAHDALVGTAAADVGAHVLDDLVARRFGFLLE